MGSGMIIKANDKLYRCDSWRGINREDEYVTVSFFEMYTDEDESKGFCCHVFPLIDEDCYANLSEKYPQLDYKDIRFIKSKASIYVYNSLLNDIIRGKNFIDIDLIDQEELCAKCVKEYLEEDEGEK